MKIALLITTHKRPEITRICFDKVAEARGLYTALGFDLHPFIAVSDDENAELGYEFGFDRFYIPNEPISNKHQTLLNHALKHDWSYMMQLGSDDFITEAGHLRIIANMLDRVEMFGFNSIYFWKFQSIDVKTIRTTLISGAGRCVRRDLIDRTMERNGFVWTPNMRRGLDGDSQNNIIKANELTTPQAIETPTPCVVDIKSHTNLNPWESMKGKHVPFELFTSNVFGG